MLDDNEMAKRAREAIQESGHTFESIAEAFDVTVQAVSGWARTGKIDKRKLPLLAKLTGKPLQFFMPDAPTTANDDDAVDIPGYASHVALGDGATPEDYAESHKLKFRASSLRRKGLLGRHLEVYYGRGDSMEPRIRDGDALLVDRSDLTPKDDGIFVLESNEGAVAKRLTEIGGQWFVVSDNTSDPKWRKPIPLHGRNHYKIIGRVRWIASWED